MNDENNGVVSSDIDPEEPSAEDLKRVEEEEFTELQAKHVFSKEVVGKGEECTGQFYFRIMGEYELLDHGEMVELAQKRDSGDDRARELMILHNLRYVVSLSKKYRFGLPQLDAIQLGNIGLMKAVDRWDWRRGYKFSTFAQFYIRQVILRELSNQAGPVRTPIYRAEKRRGVKRRLGALSTQLGRRPSLEEMVSHLGIGKEEVLEVLRGEGQEAFSLDQSIEMDSVAGATMGELYGDSRTLSPVTVVMAREEMSLIGSKIAKLIECLDSLELLKPEKKLMFKRFYGLCGTRTLGSFTTLEWVASEFGITRQRVRQVNDEVWDELARLRHKHGLDKNSLLELFDQVRDLEISAQRELKLEDLKIVQLHEGSASLSPRVVKSRASRGKTKSNFFRASPAFIHWALNGQTDKRKAVVDLVAYAYELSAEDILNRDKTQKPIVWARSLVAFMMYRELGLQESEVRREFTGHSPRSGSVNDMIRMVDEAVKEDERVAKDVEGIRGHFKKSTGS